MDMMVSEAPCQPSFEAIYVLQRHDNEYSGRRDFIVASSKDASYMRKKLIYSVLTHYDKYLKSDWSVIETKNGQLHGEVVFSDCIDEMYGASLAESWQDLRLDLLLMIEQMCKKRTLCDRLFNILAQFDNTLSSELVAECQRHVDGQRNRYSDPEDIWLTRNVPMLCGRWVNYNRDRFINAMNNFVRRKRAMYRNKIDLLIVNATHLLPKELW